MILATEYQKVWVVNILSASTVERKLGSDCTGSDGDANRVLTLANTTTSAKEMVFLDGVCLKAGTDYTANHLAASSTITFLLKVWDTQHIEVLYFT